MWGLTPIKHHTIIYLVLLDKVFQHATQLDLPAVCATKSRHTGIWAMRNNLKRFTLANASRCAIGALAYCDQLESLTLRSGNTHAELYELGANVYLPSFTDVWHQWSAQDQLPNLLEKLPRLKSFRLDDTPANYGHNNVPSPTVLFPLKMPVALVNITFFRCYHWQNFKSLLAHFGPNVTFRTDTGTLPQQEFMELPPHTHKQIRFI